MGVLLAQLESPKSGSSEFQDWSHTHPGYILSVL